VKSLFNTIFLFILGWLFLHLLLREKRRQPQPTIIAHRGAAGLAPENTLVAIRKGLAHNAGYIEADIQRSADGVLLLMHDEKVDRTTNGTGAVRQLSWAELSQLDAGSYYAPQFLGERIPTLEQALLFLRDEAATFVIEIKDPHFYPEISKEIVEMIGRYRAQNKVVVISFDHAELKVFHELAAEIRVGVLFTWPWEVSHIAHSQIVDVYWPAVLLDPTFVRRMHGRGYEVWVWTVNSAVMMRLLAWLGMDGVTTDRPELGKRLGY
jgi:glycerophosphoryl diester phosphodiesterase